MKQLLLLLIGIPCFLIAQASGIGNSKDKPVKARNPSISLQMLAKLTPKDYERLTGKKLRLKERIGLKLLQWKARKMTSGKATPKQRKQGWIALGLSLVGIICLAVPVGAIVLLGGALGIAALVLGLKSLQGNSNVPGIIAVVLGSLMSLFFFIAVIYVITNGPLF